MHPAVSGLGLVGRFGTTVVWGLRALLQGLCHTAAVLVPHDLDSLFHVWGFQRSCGISALVKIYFDLLTPTCPVRALTITMQTVLLTEVAKLCFANVSFVISSLNLSSVISWCSGVPVLLSR